MRSGNRLALTVWLALIVGVGLTAPSSAQGVAARGAHIAELSQAGKYSEPIPLARQRLADMEKAHGPVDRDVAGALNDLALLYSDVGNDAEAEPLNKRAIAIMEKVFGLDSRKGDCERPRATARGATGAVGRATEATDAGPFARIGEGAAR